jgi:ATP-dependent RNA helicase DeaD
MPSLNPVTLIKRFVARPPAPISPEVQARIARPAPPEEGAIEAPGDLAATYGPRRRRGRGSAPGDAEGAASAAASPARRQFEPQLFGSLPVSGEVRAALDDMGFTAPSPIQEGVIPVMMAGGDVVGQAQTGTGKTAAFGIPLVEKLDPALDEVQAIALCPTRELAMQVAGELTKLARYRNLRVVCLYGGQPIVKQFPKLDPPPQIVVGTPGRVLDHMGRGTLRLDKVRVVVLDEADEMLDIGFAPDMERILRTTPKARQTTLFSATMPPFIRRMIQRYMRDPQWVQVQPDMATVPEIQQVYYEVAARDKLRALKKLLEEWGEMPRALVFCRMQGTVDRLAADLQRAGYPVEGIHGGMTQAVRTRVMQGFRSGAVKALVSTNVAARGLDIPDVTHVVSFDTPQNAEEYIHRIGRTGRMGRAGLAITFVSDLEDFEVLDQIRAKMGDALVRSDSAIYAAV